MLAYYAGKLDAVEINNTFYRMPRPALLERWAAETPSTFRFALKSPRSITHMRRLVGADDAVARLAKEARALGDRLGPILFQLPRDLRKDLGVLEAFLSTWASLRGGLRAAFEFRHESWLADDVYAALARHDAALCVADSEELATPAGRHRPLGLPAPPAAGLRQGGAAPVGRTPENAALRRRVRLLQAREPKGPGRPLPIRSEA